MLSDMSLTDWIQVAIMVPFLLLMLTLFIYLTLGVLGSRARRRRHAQHRPPEPQPGKVPRQAPGD